MARGLIALLACLLSASVLAQTVCIDPGHPSEVGMGTTGKKISEVRAAWQMAGWLKARLEKRGITVVLTKSSEGQMVRNKDRAAIANKANADLMVRLHCDGMGSRGLAVYYPDRQGVSGGKKGPTRRVIGRSGIAGVAFRRAAARNLRGQLTVHQLRSDFQTAIGARQGALTGSIYSQVPVVLVEMLVLTNAVDEAFFLKHGKTKLADALEAGVMAALKALNPTERG